MVSRNFMALVVIAAAALFGTGCSVIKASPAATTPFLVHGADLHPWHERAPWDAVWSDRPGEIMIKSDAMRNVYVAPVSTQYLNLKQDKDGKWVSAHKVPEKDVKEISDLMRQSFIDEIKRHPETNLRVVDQPGPGVLVIELALVELTPTLVALNAAADVGGVLLPGSSAIAQVGAAGAQMASGTISSGTIAMEFQITDGGTGEVLVEAKDREADATSLLPNYRDFEQYGWSRHTVKEWASELVMIFNTTPDKVVRIQNEFSVVPW